MKASIIIPAYNAAKTIAQTVESALTQRFDDFEVIVVDDGSTDSTALILRTYFGNGQIVFAQKGNEGVARARNTGVAVSKGDFILPLDADDLISPDYLAKTVPLMTEGVGVVSTGMVRFGEQYDIVEPGISDWKSNKIPTCSLIRREALNQVGVWDPSMMYEDWDLWLRIIKAGWKVALLNEPLFHYRMSFTGRNAMQDKDASKYREEIRKRHA